MKIPLKTVNKQAQRFTLPELLGIIRAAFFISHKI